MNSGTKSGQDLVRNGVPHGSVVGQIVLNFFINDINDGIKCALSQSAENMVLGGVDDTGCHLKRPPYAGEMGKQEPHRVQQRKMPNPR